MVGSTCCFLTSGDSLKTPLQPPQREEEAAIETYSASIITVWQLQWRCCSFMNIPEHNFSSSKLTEEVNKVGKIFASETSVSEVILRLRDETVKMTAIHISEWGRIIWDEWSPTTHGGNHSKEKWKVKARKVQSLTKTSFKMCFYISPIQQDFKNRQVWPFVRRAKSLPY